MQKICSIRFSFHHPSVLYCSSSLLRLFDVEICYVSCTTKLYKKLIFHSCFGLRRRKIDVIFTSSFGPHLPSFTWPRSKILFFILFLLSELQKRRLRFKQIHEHTHTHTPSHLPARQPDAVCCSPAGSH